jgi:hypothetical protein
MKNRPLQLNKTRSLKQKTIYLSFLLFILCSFCVSNFVRDFEKSNADKSQGIIYAAQEPSEITQDILSVTVDDVIYLRGVVEIVLNLSKSYDYAIVISSLSSSNQEEAFKPLYLLGVLQEGINLIRFNVDVNYIATPGKTELYITLVLSNPSENMGPILATLFPVIALGYYPLILIPAFVLLTLPIIYLKQESLKESKPTSKKDLSEKDNNNKKEQEKSTNQQTAVTHAFPQIDCPDCNKSIDKGSAYCEHCGFHLPVYQRNG